MTLRQKVREMANFTPLQADIYDELATEARNNEGIILHLHLNPDRYPDRKLIIRVEGHLTCSLYGVVTDIWDCSEELVDRYWVV